jgi:hypothetical protein
MRGEEGGPLVCLGRVEVDIVTDSEIATLGNGGWSSMCSLWQLAEQNVNLERSEFKVGGGGEGGLVLRFDLQVFGVPLEEGELVEPSEASNGKEQRLEAAGKAGRQTK